MKRRNREINVFSMSALDLFACALGAFILIAIVLFPYFPNIGDAPKVVASLTKKLSVTQQQLAESQQQLQECQANLQIAQTAASEAEAVANKAQAAASEAQAKAEAEFDQCAKKLRKKFLLILMSWESSVDVDLYVRDPQGQVFSYNWKTHSESPAKMEVDNIHGPGNEIWLHPQATPGNYEVCYHFYNNYSRQNSVTVSGAYITPVGRRGIPTTTVPYGNGTAMKHVATIAIDSNGNATLRGGSAHGTCDVFFDPSLPPKY